MKKKCLLAITMLCLGMTLSSCIVIPQSSTSGTSGSNSQTSSSSAETTALYEIPNGYTDGYVYGDYSKYTDAATADEHKGDLVWIKGAMTLIRTEQTNGTWIFTPQLTTEDGKIWIILAGTSSSSVEEKSCSYDYSNLGYCFKGVYLGLTDTGIPVMAAHYGFSVKDGKNYEAFPNYVYDQGSDDSASDAAVGEEAPGESAGREEFPVESASDAAAGEETPADPVSDTAAEAPGLSDVTDNLPAAENQEAAAETPEPSISETAFEDTYSEQVSPEFKTTMDSYEAFFDSYVEFMQNYANSGDPVSLLTQYLTFLTEYSDMMTNMESIDTSSLSSADYAYYVAVLARIEQKLILITPQ